MSWLLDTNVLSESRRPKPDQRVVAFLAACPLNRLFISSVTFAEICFGIERTPEPNRRVEIERWLNQEMRPLFEGRVLQITEDVMCSAGVSWWKMAERLGARFRSLT